MVECYDSIIKFKKAYRILYNDKYFCCLNNTADIYDKEGNFLRKTKGLENPNYGEFYDNDKLIIKNTSGMFRIFNVETLDEIKKIKSIDKKAGHDSKFLLLPDKTLIDIIYSHATEKIYQIDLNTKDYCVFEENRYKFRKLFYINNDIYAILTIPKDGYNSPTWVYKVIVCDSNLQLEPIIKVCDNMCNYCDMNTNNILYTLHGSVNVFNLKTFSSKSINESLQCRYIKLSEDGKLFVFVKPDEVKIYAVDTLECIKKIKTQYANFAEFYDKDSKLLIGTWEDGYLLDLKY